MPRATLATLKKLLTFFPPVLFLVYKLSGLDYRFGDGNGYFYMAREVLLGKLLYRDILLADPPLLIYILAAIRAVIGNRWLVFMALPALLEAITSLVLYKNLKKRGLKWSFLAPAIYLSSFLILSTSDYLTGLHLIILLLNLAFLWEKRPWLSGLCWSLACLIKLYVLPGLFVYLVMLIYEKKWKYLLPFAISGLLVFVVAMMPFLLLAPLQVFEQLIVHQLNRPAGLNKWTVWSFFLRKDLLLILVAAAGMIWSRQKRLLGLILSWVVFYIIFRDLYYLYLAILAPLLVAGVITFLEYLEKTLSNDRLGYKLVMSLLMLLGLSHMPVLFNYHHYFRDDGKIVQAKQVVEMLEQLEPKVPLYGSHEVAPLIAVLTDKHLVNDYADTNAQMFASGVKDLDTISNRVVEEGAYLLTRVANIPENVKLDSGFEGYFSRELFDQCCTSVAIIAGDKKYLFSDIAIYHCKKK